MSSRLIHGNHEDISFCSFLKSRFDAVYHFDVQFDVSFLKWKTDVQVERCDP